jgi:hypothetical protein
MTLAKSFCERRPEGASSPAKWNRISEVAEKTKGMLHNVLESVHHFALGSIAGAFGAFMVYPSCPADTAWPTAITGIRHEASMTLAKSFCERRPEGCCTTFLSLYTTLLWVVLPVLLVLSWSTPLTWSRLGLLGNFMSSRHGLAHSHHRDTP